MPLRTAWFNSRRAHCRVAFGPQPQSGVRKPTTCRSGDQCCLQNGINAVRFRGTSPRSHCWTALRLLSACGQARLLLRALRSVLLAARQPDSHSGNAGSSPARNATSLPRDRSRGYEPRTEGSTPSRDATLSPADLAATLRTSRDAVRLCARAQHIRRESTRPSRKRLSTTSASMEQWWLTTFIR